MESSRLTLLYRNVTTWPKTETDLSITAKQVRQLIDIPVLAIWIPDTGLRASGLNESDGSLFEKNQAQLKSELQGFSRNPSPEAFYQFRPVTLIGSAPGIDRWLALPLATPGKTAQVVGWILIKADAALKADQELALHSTARYFGDLAALAQGESALALRDQFLSIASHELKTPLTSIYGILQLQERMLRQKKEVSALSPDQEKQHSFFKIVIRQVQRLNELIDGLLDVSRIHVGRFMVEPSDVDVVTLLHESINSRLNVIANEAGVAIQVDAPQSLRAWIDPVRFEEVVTNLGMNAIRFSPEGGVVWIKLRVDEDQFVLTVRDQGPSVPEADRARIFQPFERAQRTSRLGGLGLGLFISRQIAQLHAGDVALVESISGKGNVFEARFPIASVKKMSA